MDASRLPFTRSVGESRFEAARRARRAPAVALLLRPSESDIDTLLALRMHQNLDELDAKFDRLEAVGLIAFGDADYPSLTPRGIELLRRWLS